ncbi:PucR family transcriptional regulator [Neobacillus mesonae]|uniref:PucR family transcriptional regulator n=1 Tax=Neobacillus mesonae TaxID=1193713 RepID=UPI00203DB262|nr:PucR family transcriptional regulator [Neobacillus mesonae]MCM3571452.1 PucR family transcriptional regulator ligand-binding domain-containing protein [Neobacillus mesonae]
MTVRELLEDRYFVRYKVLAGCKGLDREIQSVALFDAPDGYMWYKGKELILSSGYLFQDNIELFEKVLIHLYEHNCAAIGIKVDRYLKQIPQKILALCDQLHFPLINVPYEPAWVEIMDTVNAIAMNKYFMRVNADHKGKGSALSALYPEHKILELVENLSRELERPVSITDFLENRNIHCPSREKNEEVEQKLRELQDPPFDFQREKVYDKLNMYRLKNLEDQQSWLIIPLEINGIAVGKLVIWEKGKGLGYFDMLALRLTYDILLYIYGQMYYMNSKEANFQDDFIQEILFEESDKEKLLRKAKNLYWDIQKQYICISFKQINQQLNMEDYRDLIYTITRRYFPKNEAPLGLLDGTLIIFYPAEDQYNPGKTAQVKKKCEQLIAALEKEIPQANIRGGIGYTASAFYEMKKSYMESMKTIEIGLYIYPNCKVLTYQDLGPFGFIHLESFKEQFDYMIKKITPVLEQDDREELISTLKAYLDSNCHFNLAAKKLYIHSNTVRYRMAKIQQLCQIDLEDAMERLKLEIVLKFVNP